MSNEFSIIDRPGATARSLAESLANLIDRYDVGIKTEAEKIYDNVATLVASLSDLQRLIQSMRKKLNARDEESDREFFDRIHRDLWLKYTGPSPEVTGEEAENLGRLICDAFANAANEDDDEYFKYEWNDISELAKNRTIKAGKYLTCWAWDEIHALRTEREGLREALIEERQDNRNAGQVLDRGVFDNSSAGVQITIGDLSLEEKAEQVVRLWKEEHESRERFEKESENRVRALFWLVYQDYVPKEDQQYALKIADGREKTAVDDPTSYALENYRKVFSEACKEDPELEAAGWAMLPSYVRVQLANRRNLQHIIKKLRDNQAHDPDVQTDTKWNDDDEIREIRGLLSDFCDALMGNTDLAEQDRYRSINERSRMALQVIRVVKDVNRIFDGLFGIPRSGSKKSEKRK